MKYILIAAALTLSSISLQAQTPGTGQRTGAATSGSNSSNKQNVPAGQRSTQTHGSRDTTPGSPMGTGGAGGGDMSGSPAGSAIQTRDQTDKANENRHQSTKKTSSQPKTTRKKTSSQQ